MIAPPRRQEASPQALMGGAEGWAEGPERTPEERRKALGREISRKFYSRYQEALQRKAYFRCLEKGMIRTIRPSTALKYGIQQARQVETLEF